MYIRGIKWLIIADVCLRNMVIVWREVAYKTATVGPHRALSSVICVLSCRRLILGKWSLYSLLRLHSWYFFCSVILDRQMWPSIQLYRYWRSDIVLAFDNVMCSYTRRCFILWWCDIVLFWFYLCCTKMYMLCSCVEYYYVCTLWVKKNCATFIFTVTLANVGRFLPARRYASAGNSDRNVSVRLSVRPSRAGIVSKLRKIAAWFLHHLVAPRL